jgi:hypothetical protein
VEGDATILETGTGDTPNPWTDDGGDDELLLRQNFLK